MVKLFGVMFLVMGRIMSCVLLWIWFGWLGCWIGLMVC